MVTTADDVLKSMIQAPAVSTPKKPRKSSGKQREEVPMNDDQLNFDHLVAIKIVMEALEGQLKQMKADATQKGIKHFIDEMLRSKNKPESFTAKGKATTALCILKRIGANRPLDEHAVELLNRFDIHTEEVEITPRRLVIAPEVFEEEDQATLKAMAEAIAASDHPLLKGKQLFCMQEAESKHVVSENTIPDVARKVDDPDMMRQLVLRVSQCELRNYKIEGLKEKHLSKQAALEIIRDAGILVTPKEESSQAS